MPDTSERSSVHKSTLITGPRPVTQCWAVGGGGDEEKSCENFFGSKNLKFLEIYPTPLNLEGANRILFKVSIDIFADMGGICV